MVQKAFSQASKDVGNVCVCVSVIENLVELNEKLENNNDERLKMD